MTHWMGLVIVKPPSVGNSIAEQLERILTPFDSDPPEGTEPMRKNDVCYCATRQLRRDATQYSIEKLGFKDYKEMSNAADKERDAAGIYDGEGWEPHERFLHDIWHPKYYRPMRFWEHQYLTSHKVPSKQYPLEPDKDCDECNGTGYAMQNIGKWDYWSIGGRYDGEILMAPRKHVDRISLGVNSAEYAEARCNEQLLQHNLIAVDAIDATFTGCAVIGPDHKGETVWFDRDADFEADYAFRLGFQTYTNPDALEEQWTELFQSRLALYKGGNLLAVGIDYHN